MRALYFAYGSNLKAQRLRDRVPSAETLGPARLPGYRFRCDKLGGDGSAKANLRVDADACVWGALYRLDPSQWPRLDAIEARYARVCVRVEAHGSLWTAETYVSEAVTDDPVPRAWYRSLILEGAREHALPEDYVRDALEALPWRED